MPYKTYSIIRQFQNKYHCNPGIGGYYLSINTAADTTLEYQGGEIAMWSIFWAITKYRSS